MRGFLTLFPNIIFFKDTHRPLTMVSTAENEEGNNGEANDHDDDGPKPGVFSSVSHHSGYQRVLQKANNASAI